ncbi:SCO3242 family prenyltransferase [Streptomyces iranensis]|uniref:4-hydroxybenzoate polyprenyltransferase n=1 Tax=Streptomyces iranensis TaxID=576784 RepID=A0A060ZHR9_9ACTN|nr:UbiA family prenyltransferase [Streptomyces iranensis]MBP2061194.1 4-hydroxybenzoate polyprenyltransferase [Streptomyces iranensis]CDR05538.1 UbiA prenyltransferase [Streptomyces iranensis]
MTGEAGERGPFGTWGDWAELLRVSALFTVVGDALAGAAAARRGPNRGTALAVCTSLCLYEAGMALNDWADRDIDAVERPGRPLPSGRIAPAAALTAATGLTGAGLLCAAAAGRPALATATALASTVWAYDLGLKNTPAGPPTMAAARALDLLLGATASAGHIRPALRPAALLGAHTLAVTMVSRREAVGGSSVAPLGALATGAAIAWATARRPAPASGHGPGVGHGAPVAMVNGATSGAPVGGVTAGGAIAALAGGLSRTGSRRDGPARRLVATVVAGRRAAVAAATGRGGLPGGPRVGVGLRLTVASGGAAAERTRPVGRIATAAGAALAGGRAGDALPRSVPSRGAAVSRFAAVAGVALAGGYVATIARPLAHAALNPSPYLLQRAVGSGIRAMIPLQAVLASRAGAHRTAAGLLALMPVARRLSRKVSAT